MLVSLLFSAALMAQPDERHIDAPYTQVRTEMIRAGYLPTRISGRAPCSETLFEETCRTYPEVIDCSGTGAGYCEFNFAKRTGERLTVVTRGESRLRAIIIRRP